MLWVHGERSALSRHAAAHGPRRVAPQRNQLVACRVSPSLWCWASRGRRIWDFWLVYHLNFAHSDYFDLPSRLPAQGLLLWAIVARDADELRRRAERVGAHGRIVDFEELKLFLPDPTQASSPPAIC